MTGAPSRLPSFVVVEKADGTLAVRKLARAEDRAGTVERLRARFARVWLAHAYQSATGPAETRQAEQ